MGCLPAELTAWEHGCGGVSVLGVAGTNGTLQDCLCLRTRIHVCGVWECGCGCVRACVRAWSIIEGNPLCSSTP